MGPITVASLLARFTTCYDRHCMCRVLRNPRRSKQGGVTGDTLSLSQTAGRLLLRNTEVHSELLGGLATDSLHARGVHLGRNSHQRVVPLESAPDRLVSGRLFRQRNLDCARSCA